MTGTGIYREEALEQDQMTITQYLQNKGYADAKVKISVAQSPDAGKIVITVTANKGPIYHFGKIAFNGNTLFTNEEVEKQFVARPGGIYSPQSLQMTVQNIQDLYGRKGYIEASVQYETKLSSDGDIYNVEFWISEGEQYKIGMIHVVGNAQTKAHVILRESLLVPGETFDSAKLKATQSRLEAIGYFKSVNVYAVRTQDDVLLGENYRDVYIEVEETTTGNISLFFGFSTADSAFGGLDLGENNFNAAGIPYIFKKGLSSVRGGGEYLRAKATVGSKNTDYTISWMNPYFRDTLWRLGFDTSYSHNHLQAKSYNTSAIGGSVNASYPLNSLWTFGTKYRIKHDMSHASQNASSQEKLQASYSGLVSAVSANLSFDSTDSAMKPRRGFRSFMEAEFAGVGGDFSFLRFSYLNTYYTPLWSRGTMKYRFDMRFIEPILKTHQPDHIPLGERFFMGGENSVRGYEPYKLGQWFRGRHDPQGGISSTLLSVEYLQNVFKMLDLFVFADGGALTMHRFQIPKMRLSYGFGARIDLLNRIPMIIGWGFPVNPRRDWQVKNMFFSMGGQF
jgi:outer membrane protein insertion porin family